VDSSLCPDINQAERARAVFQKTRADAVGSGGASSLRRQDQSAGAVPVRSISIASGTRPGAIRAPTGTDQPQGVLSTTQEADRNSRRICPRLY